MALLEKMLLVFLGGVSAAGGTGFWVVGGGYLRVIVVEAQLALGKGVCSGEAEMAAGRFWQIERIERWRTRGLPRTKCKAQLQRPKACRDQNLKVRHQQPEAC